MENPETKHHGLLWKETSIDSRAAGWQSTGFGERRKETGSNLEIRRPRPSRRPAMSCPFEIPSRSMSPLFVLKFWSPFVKLVVVLELDQGWLCDLSKKPFHPALTEEAQLSHPTSEKWSLFNDVYDKVESVWKWTHFFFYYFQFLTAYSGWKPVYHRKSFYRIPLPSINWYLEGKFDLLPSYLKQAHNLFWSSLNHFYPIKLHDFNNTWIITLCNIIPFTLVENAFIYVKFIVNSHCEQRTP